MEPLFVVAAIVVVAFVLLVRFRSGGSGSPSVEPPGYDPDAPRGYGATFHPPGTPPQAGTDVGWFSRPHDGDGRNNRASE